jgi:hypothetical protein
MPLPTSSPEPNQVSQSNRLPGAALVAAAALLAGVAFASAQAPGRNSRSTAEKADRQQTTKKPDFRLREGEEITDEAGYFSMTGDRVTFFTDGGTRRLVGLENLNLQRIIQEIEDGTGTSSWVVSGTITEFRGGNYILVSRAMLKQQ